MLRGTDHRCPVCATMLDDPPEPVECDGCEPGHRCAVCVVDGPPDAEMSECRACGYLVPTDLRLIDLATMRGDAAMWSAVDVVAWVRAAEIDDRETAVFKALVTRGAFGHEVHLAGLVCALVDLQEAHSGA